MVKNAQAVLVHQWLISLTRFTTSPPVSVQVVLMKFFYFVKKTSKTMG